MGSRKPAAPRNPAPAAKVAPKPGDDVTAEYYAQSNTAVDGIHFAYGESVIGVTDRDQIALAVRIGAIGRDPPGAVVLAADAAAQIDAVLTDAGAADVAAAKKLLASVTGVFVDLGVRMGEGANVLIELTKEAFECADTRASVLEEAAKAAAAASEAADATDDVKAAAATATERAKVAREAADAAFAAFEDAEGFVGEYAKFDAALKAAVAELGK